MNYQETITLKNGKECVIRNAVGKDGQAVLDIFNLTHEQTDFLSSYSDQTNFDAEFERAFLTELEKSEKDVYLCAVVDEKIVGVASVFSVGMNKVSHRGEMGIAVEKAYWGMGIGRKLTQACIQCAKAACYAQLELEVVGDNKNAVSLYRKMGFTEFGRNPRGFRSRFSGWQELVYMRLELD